MTTMMRQDLGTCVCYIFSSQRLLSNVSVGDSRSAICTDLFSENSKFARKISYKTSVELKKPAFDDFVARTSSGNGL
ncbi:hypothetical protein ACTXT7_000048 [Hymenolepis weldensis]